MAMTMNGEVHLPASREVVWQKLNDPAVLKKCIPGCEELASSGENQFQAIARMKVGPVSARFGGRVTLSELGPPNGYRISGEGEGGVAGFAKGGSIAFIEPRSQRLFTSLVAVAVTTSIRRVTRACSLSLSLSLSLSSPDNSTHRIL